MNVCKEPPGTTKLWRPGGKEWAGGGGEETGASRGSQRELWEVSWDGAQRGAEPSLGLWTAAEHWSKT